ncbi:MAG: hypothetical protein GY859_08360 [Desulfobacterales bacterium]|nr:hypothetical protein [Desulfobacterales bacterium]
MENITKIRLSRREFVRAAAITAAAAAAPSAAFAASAPIVRTEPGSAVLFRLNPAYRMREISGNEVELFTRGGDGRMIRKTFSGRDADLLREIAGERGLETIISNLCRKRSISLEACETEVKQGLVGLQKAGVVYRDKKMMVKIVEVENAR